MVSALKADMEDIQTDLYLTLKISDIPKGDLDKELHCSSKATQIDTFW